MSLLADLLSKAKNEGDKNTTVPPQLASIITRASDKKKRQAKFIILAAIVLFVVVVGFGFIYYLDIYMKPSGMLKTTAGLKTSPPGPRAPMVQTQQGQPPASGPPQETPARPATKADIVPEGPKKTVQADAGQPKTGVPAEPRETRPAPAKEEPAATSEGLKKTDTENTVEGPAKPKPVQLLARDTPKKETAEERRKGNRDASLYAAKNFEESGNLPQAIAGYKKALQLDGKNYVIMASLAGALIKTGSYAEAAQYSRLALNNNPNYVPAMTNLAIASIQLGNLTEGEQNLLRARALEPFNKSVLFNLALLYENQKRYQDAYGVYEKIAAANNDKGLIGMGRILEKQGRRDDARKVYREILSSNTTNASTKRYANERLVMLGN